MAVFFGTKPGSKKKIMECNLGHLPHVGSVFFFSGEERRGDVTAFLPKVRPGGILCGHDFWKTMDYTKAILSNVPFGKTLNLGHLVSIFCLRDVLSPCSCRLLPLKIE